MLGIVAQLTCLLLICITPSPTGRRCRAAADEGKFATPNPKPLIRPSATFSQEEKGQTLQCSHSDPVKEELARHQGTWAVTSFVRDGQETPKEIATSIIRIVEGDHVTWKREGKSFAGTSLILDASTDPKSLDVIPDGGPSKDQRVLGIYKLEGDVLIICMAGPAKARPKMFTAESGSGLTLMTFRREALK